MQAADLNCLRSLSTDEIVRVQTTLERPGTLVYLPWLPVIDGDELIRDPYESLRQGTSCFCLPPHWPNLIIFCCLGDFQRMPVIVGTNANEYGVWLCMGGPSRLNLTEADVIAYLGQVFPQQQLEQIIQEYNFQTYKYPIQLAIGTRHLQ